MHWREKVLSRIKPTEKEENALKSLQIRVIETVKRHAGSKEVLCVGSTAKNTWLKDANDIDVFVKFPIEISRQDLEKEGLEIGKKSIKELKGSYVIAYAEHPYVRGEASGYKIEIVPCYSVETPEKIQSAVDRSPFHLEYVNTHLDFGQRDDVRILKAFLKANCLYGADLKTEGFSGYLCELLIISYGTFEKLMEAAKDWKPGQVIKLKHDAAIKEPLVLIDPVDPKRNVAAAVSAESMMKFIRLAKDFCKRPSEILFKEKRVPKLSQSQFSATMKQRGTQILTVVFEKPDVLDDTLYPQLRRLATRLKDILRHHEFMVARTDFLVKEKEIFMVLELEISTLSKIEKKYGPLIFDAKHSEQFLNKYKKPLARYIENNVWIVEIPRKFVDAKTKLNDTLKDTARILREKGIPSYLASSISKGFRILDAEKTKHLLADDEFARFMHSYFHKMI